MSLDEAMTGLSIQVEVKRRLGKNQEADAIQLGLEALKVLDLARFNSNGEWPPPLPSETIEKEV